MYRDLNDYEILYLIKENDFNDYEIIYEKYRPLIYKIALKYKNTCKSFGYELDDLMQVGYLALFKSVKTFHYECDNTFYTYILHVIENSIIGVIRGNNTNRSRVLNESISYDILLPGTDVSYIDIISDPKSERDILDIFEQERNFIVFKNTLSFDVACIFELKFNGFLNDEISKLLEISLKDVKKGINKIKKQLLYR